MCSLGTLGSYIVCTHHVFTMCPLGIWALVPSVCRCLSMAYPNLQEWYSKHMSWAQFCMKLSHLWWDGSHFLRGIQQYILYIIYIYFWYSTCPNLERAHKLYILEMHGICGQEESPVCPPTAPAGEWPFSTLKHPPRQY